MTNPLSATCHCGAVHVQVAHAPGFIFECNCSLCESHGVWWGYYTSGEVEVAQDMLTMRLGTRREATPRSDR